MSKTIDINMGVPQGSRLSPLLFICLMADLDLWTKESMITNFADNTQSVIIKDGKDEAIATAKKEANTNSVIKFFENNYFVNNSDKAAVLYNSAVEGKENPYQLKVLGEKQSFPLIQKNYLVFT